MKERLISLIMMTIALLSCHQQEIKYELYSNGKFVFEIIPTDIVFYDTTQTRSGIEIHELRLKDNFYKQDSFVLNPPLKLICKINNDQYFWSDFFQKAQSQPRLWVNFKFRSSCNNDWTFQQQKPGELILRKEYACNSIEFFHSQMKIEQARKTYYEKKEYFQNYTDTARLAHEILLDPYYLEALKESGVEIR